MIFLSKGDQYTHVFLSPALRVGYYEFIYFGLLIQNILTKPNDREDYTRKLLAPECWFLAFLRLFIAVDANTVHTGVGRVTPVGLYPEHDTLRRLCLL